MPATFDGDNLLIILPTATSEIDAKVDLYSDWKEWFKTGTNSKYPLAFDTTGGDPATATKSVAPYYFLRNDLGWRIRPAEENANVTVIGNLYGRDPALPILTQTVGTFTVLMTIERSTDALQLTISTGSGLSGAQDALLTKIGNIVEADEQIRATTYKKFLKGTTTPLVSKNVTVAGSDVDLVEP